MGVTVPRSARVGKGSTGQRLRCSWRSCRLARSTGLPKAGRLRILPTAEAGHGAHSSLKIASLEAGHARHDFARTSCDVAIGAKGATVAGLLLLAAGLVWLSFIDPAGSYSVDGLPASLVAALGMSLAIIPTLGAAISASPPEEGGLASGIVNTSYQVGSARSAAMTAVTAARAPTGSAMPAR